MFETVTGLKGAIFPADGLFAMIGSGTGTGNGTGINGSYYITQKYSHWSGTVPGT